MQIRRFDFGLSRGPSLTESVYDGGQILPEHLAQLSFYLLLDELLDDSDGVKGAVDVDVLQWVGFEDEGDSFLLGDDEDDVGVESKVGESQEHGYNQRLVCCENPS